MLNPCRPTPHGHPLWGFETKAMELRYGRSLHSLLWPPLSITVLAQMREKNEIAKEVNWRIIWSEQTSASRRNKMGGLDDERQTNDRFWGPATICNQTFWTKICVEAPIIFLWANPPELADWTIHWVPSLSCSSRLHLFPPLSLFGTTSQTQRTDTSLQSSYSLPKRTEISFYIFTSLFEYPRKRLEAGVPPAVLEATWKLLKIPNLVEIVLQTK